MKGKLQQNNREIKAANGWAQQRKRSTETGEAGGGEVVFVKAAEGGEWKGGRESEHPSRGEPGGREEKETRGQQMRVDTMREQGERRKTGENK